MGVDFGGRPPLGDGEHWARRFRLRAMTIRVKKAGCPFFTRILAVVDTHLMNKRSKINHFSLPVFLYHHPD
jgi:hypothetical protein